MLNTSRLIITLASSITALAQTTVTLTPTASPSSGQAGTTTVSVTGTGFPSGTITPAQVTVRLAPAPGSSGPAAQTPASAVTTVTGSTRRVTFVIPASLIPAAATPYRVTLEGAIVQSTSSFANFTINPAPSLSTITPAAGTQSATGDVAITGRFSSFLRGVTTVSLGADIVVNTVTVSSPTNLVANVTIPAGAALGPRNIAVTTGAEALTLPGGFSVQASTAATASPAAGDQGQTLSVAVTDPGGAFVQGATAANFGPGVTVSSITVAGATAATIQLAIQPGAAAGPRTFSLITALRASVGSFTINAVAARLTSMTPPSARQGDSNLVVTISGQFTSFTSGSAVSLGSGVTLTSIAAPNPTTIQALLSVSATATPGPRSLTVDGLTLANAFTVQPGLPRILSITPDSGSPGATVTVTIVGQFTNFTQGSSVFRVSYWGTSSSVRVLSPTQLTATITIPLSAPLGRQDAGVVTGTERPVLAGGFLVPSFSISPNFGQPGQRVSVTLTGLGTHFAQGASTVWFYNAPGLNLISNVVVSSPTYLTFDISIPPDQPTGFVQIAVTTGSETVFAQEYFALTSGLPSQKISGVVYLPDGVTPAAGVSVRYYGLLLDGTLAIGTTTDINGAFELSTRYSGPFTLYAIDSSTSPTRIGLSSYRAPDVQPPPRLTLAAPSQVTVRASRGPGVIAPNAVIEVFPSGPPIPADLRDLLLKSQTAGADGQTTFTLALPGRLVVTATDQSGQYSAAVVIPPPNGAATVDVTLNPFEIASKIVSAGNRAAAVTLPAGQNEAVSKIVSISNGLLTNTFPTGMNEAASSIVAVFNGVLSNSLPPGRNESYTKIVAAQVASTGGTTTLVTRSRPALQAPGDEQAAAQSGPPLSGPLTAGETVTFESDLAAPFYVNGVLAGNDASSPNRLTLVVPSGLDSLSVRAGQSQDALWQVGNAGVRQLPGTLLKDAGAPVAEALVHARYSGLRAEIFDLEGLNGASADAPDLGGLQPVAEAAVSSLNLRNPEGIFGPFPAAPVQKPNIAVRLSGEFLVESDGEYRFALASSGGARLSIDGVPKGVVRAVRPGTETPMAVTLSRGWKRFEIVTWQAAGALELVVTYAPPGSADERRPVPDELLRSAMPGPAVKPGPDGRFSLQAPGWAANVEAVVDFMIGGERQSAVAPSASGGFGRIQLKANSLPNQIQTSRE